LILVGELDDAAPAKECREAVASPADGSAPVKLVVYPGARHDFDRPNLSGDGSTFLGHRYQYNEAADHAAADEVHEFIRKNLGR
jgi:dienelactone hydrolase